MVTLDDYDYDLPPKLIAHEPVEPRDTARLFVYDTASDTVTHTTFEKLPELIPDTLMVLNETKVVPARLKARRHNGQEIELFVLFDRGVAADGTIEAMANCKLDVGEEVTVGNHRFRAINTTEKQFRLLPLFPIEALRELLLDEGVMPLPPYIESALPESARRTEYQTVFAVDEGSVAAPTASLHFTEGLLKSLPEFGIATAKVRLNVGLGTFAPIFAEDVARGTLHAERYAVPAETSRVITEAKQAARPVVAVGTTVVRTLESALHTILSGEAAAGDTTLFIQPSYHFAIPDMLVTNFHVPKSSLLLLVDAFLRDKGASSSVLDLYQEAIKERYRFFSFGDAMLIR